MKDGGQITVRLPREAIEKLRPICWVTGDHGLSKLCKRLLLEELERVTARLVEQSRDRAKKIGDDMVQQHREAFPTTVAITEYLDQQTYRALSEQQPAEIMPLAEHQALWLAVADEIEARFGGRVNVVRQAIGKEYLRWLEENNIQDSRGARARFATMISRDSFSLQAAMPRHTRSSQASCKGSP